MNRSLLALSTCLPLLALSCTSDEDASVEVSVWGEDFIEVGITADDMVDGWAIEFDRFDVELRDITVNGASLPEAMTFDLSEDSGGNGQVVGTATVAPGDFDVGFVIASTQVEGTATKDGVTKTFSWSFTTPSEYSNCETTGSASAGETGDFEITVHADHLFYDSYVAAEPDLRFDAIAAADDDGDGDGVVTQAELEAAGLGAYDPGNLDVDTLWGYIAALAAGMGHVDGEGHCDASPS